MPFEKGKATEGAGRKGYEIESENLRRMNDIVRSDLLLIKKLQKKEELSEKQIRILQITKERVLKYLDKLHTNKSENKIDLNFPQTLIDLIKMSKNNESTPKSE